MNDKIKFFWLYLMISVTCIGAVSFIFIQPYSYRAMIIIPSASRSHFLQFINNSQSLLIKSKNIHLREFHNGNLEFIINALDESDLKSKIKFINLNYLAPQQHAIMNKWKDEQTHLLMLKKHYKKTLASIPVNAPTKLCMEQIHERSTLTSRAVEALYAAHSALERDINFLDTLSNSFRLPPCGTEEMSLYSEISWNLEITNILLELINKHIENTHFKQFTLLEKSPNKIDLYLLTIGITFLLLFSFTILPKK